MINATWVGVGDAAVDLVTEVGQVHPPHPRTCAPCCNGGGDVVLPDELIAARDAAATT